MLNQISVGIKELNTLTEELKYAYESYQKSYKALEEGLTNLTQKGFTGSVAPVIMNTFNTKVKPNGEAMMNVVNRAIVTMEEQTLNFNRAVGNMEDIARQ